MLEAIAPPASTGEHHDLNLWNPATGDSIKVSWLLLGTLFLGPFYLIFRRLSGPALQYFLVTFVPMLCGLLFPPIFLIGLGMAIYLPFRAESITRAYYLKRGWLDLGAQAKNKPSVKQAPAASIPDPVQKSAPIFEDAEGIPTYKL